MKVDGKVLAQDILGNLKKRVSKLVDNNVIPHLTVILVGNDPASSSYVSQKEKHAKAIGGNASVVRFPEDVSQEELTKTIETLNEDTSVHGIIVQRPLPEHINEEEIDEAVAVEKDIDAFKKDSPFTMPLASAVLHTLSHIAKQAGKTVFSYLKTKHIVVVGKGKTGGGPTISLLREMGLDVTVIDSKTQNAKEILKTADIIISTVGKRGVITKDVVKRGAVLLGVGMHKGEDGKLHGDYDVEEIGDSASFYTPVPGGIGPINVAKLLENLVQAAENHGKK